MTLITMVRLSLELPRLAQKPAVTFSAAQDVSRVVLARDSINVTGVSE
jgi:hypothetical protein